MSAGRIVAAILLAPIPLSLLSDTADKIASVALVAIMLGAVIVSVARYVIAERRLDRECTRPLEVAETIEVTR